MPKRKFGSSRSHSAVFSKRQRQAVSTVVQSTLKKQAEWKYLCVTANGGIPDTGSVISISDVTQGDGDSNRNGDMIQASSVGLRYHWLNGDPYNYCRFMLVQWYPDSTPSITDILLTSSYMSCYNTDQAQNYKILWDRTHLVQEMYSGQSVGTPIVYKKVRVSRRKIQYQGGGTTGTGKIYYVAVTDSAAISHPTLVMEARLNYMDF